MKPSMYRTMNFCVSLFMGAALLSPVQESRFAPLAGSSTQPRSIQALGSIFNVNSTADLPDTDVGDGVCLASNGDCTLRAAIQQANFTAGADTINLPAGVFLLTRPGLDDAAVLGDLDITDDLTINGAGSGVTIVDGNGTVTGDRVFQIFSSAKATTLSGLTIRNGKRTNTFDEGGGLYWDGGGSYLHLKYVTVSGNSSPYAGGLYLNFSTYGDTVDLDHIIVSSNTATAAGGGLGVNFGDQATFDLHDSQVYSNTAYEGGGVYFQSTLTSDATSLSIANTPIYSNTASLSAGFENRSGDNSVPVTLQNSNLYLNHASFYGGGIGNYGTLNILNTTLDSNSAVTRGGGIYNYEGGVLGIQQSTLSRNTSTTGGGVYSEFFLHNTAQMVLTNSTLSGNSASQDGGAVYADGGQISLYNATIAANQVLVPQGTVYSGMGGGVYLATRVGFSAQNALIADNTHRYGTALPVADDCLGPLNSLGYNLIEDTVNCTISGDTTGNITGQDPLLAPLASNGFPTQTLDLLPGSPAINAGTNTGCPSTDQRGISRPQGTLCDIGAVEYAVATFADVPLSYWAWQYVERLYNAGITGGCGVGPLTYCPDSNVTRAQMAVFLEKGLHGSSFSPPVVPLTFTDTGASFAKYWIESLKSDGITTGCGGTSYCPDASVTRAQMALFLLKSEHGFAYLPPLVGSSTGFSDVPTSYWAAAWIKQLAAEGITGGCGSGIYCPDSSVTRAQMAVFLVKTFALP